MDLKHLVAKELESKSAVAYYYKIGWLSLLVVIVILYLSMLWRIIFLGQTPMEFVDIFVATNISLVTFLMLAQKTNLFTEKGLHQFLIRHTLLIGISLLIINLFFFGSFSIAFFISALVGFGIAWLLGEKVIKKLP
ncbi:MAG: hypothetical protein D5R97_01875 [Candidatus Syntrophonatronum acetioxidans]|uniref:Uncharacterized protein n=1 Tax=Candidatus Syntrophonatronum acetioxidans TaxID=1795816 RepID=A0A424YHK0_9FIRM|nr:MAG: hypothetical protein D5R97_01875 [Candidatus Syntrophonatronum acetioxidans]